jgi:hypothetical protein
MGDHRDLILAEILNLPMPPSLRAVNKSHRQELEPNQIRKKQRYFEKKPGLALKRMIGDKPREIEADERSRSLAQDALRSVARRLDTLRLLAAPVDRQDQTERRRNCEDGKRSGRRRSGKKGGRG